MPPRWYTYPRWWPERTVAPPASAVSDSPRSRLWQARCTATSEVEQAVCTVTEGPVRLSLYETRVAR